VEISFNLSIAKVGSSWRATLIQTEGEPVIPAEGVSFDGKSVAAAERRADDYILDLGIDGWETTFDFSGILTPNLQRGIKDAYQASEEAELAEYRMVRTTHQVVEDLLRTRFSLRDAALFLFRSKSDIHRILKEGRTYREMDAKRSNNPSEVTSDTTRPNFGNLFELCTCDSSTCTQCSGFQLTPRTAEALYLVGQLLSDQAFDDVEQHGDGPVTKEGDWFVFHDYPRITWTQDSDWRRRAARSFDDLSSDIASGEWPLPTCAAEEMALHCMIDLVEAGVADEWINIEPSFPKHRDDFQWASIRTIFLQDEDILELFNPGLDGIEDPKGELNRYSGMGDYRPSAWFTTFSNMTPRDVSRGFRR
jgi:hypothetical protein